MAGYEQSITWGLLRPHLLQVGCPSSDPTRIGPDVLCWSLDPATRRVAIGWEAPGLVRLARGFAMKGDTETRWVAYELDAGPIDRDIHICVPSVLVLEADFGPDRWRLRATLLDSREATLAAMKGWEDGCRAIGLRNPFVVDFCGRVAA
jgi:hypothetical protein